MAECTWLLNFLTPIDEFDNIDGDQYMDNINIQMNNTNSGRNTSVSSDSDGY